MPTYEYECPKCGHQFEKFQMMSDPPVKVCPECKGRSVKRLLGTGAGFIFKGSGFYITDNRSQGYEKAKKAESGSADKGTEGKAKEATGSKDKAPSAKQDTPKKPAKKDGKKGTKE